MPKWMDIISLVVDLYTRGCHPLTAEVSYRAHRGVMSSVDNDVRGHQSQTEGFCRGFSVWRQCWQHYKWIRELGLMSSGGWTLSWPLWWTRKWERRLSLGRGTWSDPNVLPSTGHTYKATIPWKSDGSNYFGYMFLYSMTSPPIQKICWPKNRL